MPVISVMYPGTGGTSLDHEYYNQSHMPLVRRLWSPLGLQETKVLRGVPGPDGAAPAYTVVTLLTFSSMDAFKDASAKHGAEIFADIPNFTDSKPVLQFNEAV